MANISIVCKGCGETFLFTDNEQAFYKEKGLLNNPERCSTCRKAARGQRSDRRDNDRNQREMFPAVCDGCGKETMVPFRPTTGKPVYCRDCFKPNYNR
jgi:CxxC-x17-CxxC domain-containing protein